MTQGLLYSFKTIEIFILYRLILDIIKPCVSYMWVLVGFKNKKIKILHVNSKLGVAKFDTTREPDTTRHEISRLWVEA